MKFHRGQFLSALVLCLGALGVSSVGCELIASVDRQQIDPGGVGGEGSGGAAGSMTGGGMGGTAGGGGVAGGGGAAGAGGAECMQASECPATASECILAMCDMGMCTEMNASQGTIPPTQMMGDCKQNVCDGNGGVVSEDIDDPEDDNKDCTVDACSNGMPTHDPESLGAVCDDDGGVVCNNMGACVECLTVAECDAGEICQMGNCILPACANAMKDGNETDIDCGGVDCNPCGTNKNCMMGSDCVSKVCTGGKCQAAACNDMTKNGSETDVDCGGAMCPKCADNKGCSVASDCQSGVCMGGLCKAPTCMDGVLNGTETDIDCGGATCSKCADTKMCVMNSDCMSGNCALGVCVPMGVGGAGGVGGLGGAGGMGGAGGN